MNFLTVAKLKNFLKKQKTNRVENEPKITYEILNYKNVLDKYIDKFEKKKKEILDSKREKICNNTELSHYVKIELINKHLDEYDDDMYYFFQTVHFKEAEIAPEDYCEKDYWYEKLWSSVDAEELTSKLKKLNKKTKN